MKYCEQCGHKVNTVQKFCKECGKAIKAESIHAKVAVHKEIRLKPDTMIKKSNKQSWIRLKVALFTCMIIMISAFVCHRSAEAYFDRNAQIDRLVDTLFSENYDEIVKILHSTTSEMVIDLDSTAFFTDSLPEEVNRSEVITALQIEGRFESLEVVSKGTSYHVYETYILELHPFYITLSSSMEGVTFLVDKDRVGVSDGENLSLSL